MSGDTYKGIPYLIFFFVVGGGGGVNKSRAYKQKGGAHNRNTKYGTMIFYYLRLFCYVPDTVKVRVSNMVLQ